MARPKSFLQRLDVDGAKKAHGCQHGSSHRIAAGDTRLKLRIGRVSEHFCVACALAVIDRDITWLREIRRRLEEER